MKHITYERLPIIVIGKSFKQIIGVSKVQRSTGKEQPVAVYIYVMFTKNVAHLILCKLYVVTLLFPVPIERIVL